MASVDKCSPLSPKHARVICSLLDIAMSIGAHVTPLYNLRTGESYEYVSEKYIYRTLMGL